MGELDWQFQEAAGYGERNRVLELMTLPIKLSTAPALGNACRYGGIDCVKILVENGAKFSDYDCSNHKYYPPDYSLMLLDSCKWRRCFLGSKEIDFNEYFRKTSKKARRNLLSKEERIQIIDLLLEYQDTADFKPDNLLFYAILAEDYEIATALRRHNITLSSHIWDGLFKQRNSVYWRMLNSISCRMKDMPRFIAILEELCIEANGYKMHCGMGIVYKNNSLFSDVNLMHRLLNCFDSTDLNKSEIMRIAVYYGNTEYFEMFEELGWLRLPRTRDMLINCAVATKKIEVTAWLLDYKNRTADIIEEQTRKEKALLRELAAAPNSLLAMRKQWGFKTTEEDTICIVSYKGSDTSIIVPEKIGKRPVTVIGQNAFSRYLEFRQVREITTITLPNGIRELQRNAFSHLPSLESVNIPDTVGIMKWQCFGGCSSLKSIKIPGSLKIIPYSAFVGCSNLEEVILSPGIQRIESYAFASCPLLKKLYIPNTVEWIDNRAVDDHVVLQVCKGSAAHEYAISHELRYEFISEQLE